MFSDRRFTHWQHVGRPTWVFDHHVRVYETVTTLKQKDD